MSEQEKLQFLLNQQQSLLQQNTTNPSGFLTTSGTLNPHASHFQHAPAPTQGPYPNQGPYVAPPIQGHVGGFAPNPVYPYPNTSFSPDTLRNRSSTNFGSSGDLSPLMANLTFSQPQPQPHAQPQPLQPHLQPHAQPQLHPSFMGQPLHNSTMFGGGFSPNPSGSFIGVGPGFQQPPFNQTAPFMLNPWQGSVIAPPNANYPMTGSVLQLPTHTHQPSTSQSADGWTEVHHAAYKGDAATIQKLAQSGHNIEMATTFGFTPLHVAAQNGHVDCVRVLLDLGAPVNVKTRDNTKSVTPVYLAAQGGHQNVIPLLVNKGANVEVISDDRCTPLYVASQEGHVGAVRALLECGANSNTNVMATALHIAASMGRLEVAQMLLREGGADIDAKTPGKGKTPLMMAAMNDQREMVEFLLQQKANPSIKTRPGPDMENDKSALDFARLKGFQVIVTMLERALEPAPAPVPTPTTTSTTTTTTTTTPSSSPSPTTSPSMTNVPKIQAIWNLDDVKIDLQERLGKGSYGEVWKCSVQGIPGTFAVKIVELKGNKNERERLRKSFDAELAIMTMLNREDVDHIVRIAGVKRSDDKVCLVMELYAKSLKAIIEKKIMKGPTKYFTPQEMMKFALQIAKGLKTTHNMQIAHRDLKPENILATYDGNANTIRKLYLVDFGVSKIFNDDEDRTVGVTGSPPYMAPEIGRGAYSAYLADMWSYGITLYEIMTGRRPTAKPPKLPENVLSNPQMATLRDIYLQCVNMDPTKRPTAAELVQRLAAQLATES